MSLKNLFLVFEVIAGENLGTQDTLAREHAST